MEPSVLPARRVTLAELEPIADGCGRTGASGFINSTLTEALESEVRFGVEKVPSRNASARVANSIRLRAIQHPRRDGSGSGAFSRGSRMINQSAIGTFFGDRPLFWETKSRAFRSAQTMNYHCGPTGQTEPPVVKTFFCPIPDFEALRNIEPRESAKTG